MNISVPKWMYASKWMYNYLQKVPPIFIKPCLLHYVDVSTELQLEVSTPWDWSKKAMVFFCLDVLEGVSGLVLGSNLLELSQLNHQISWSISAKVQGNSKFHKTWLSRWWFQIFSIFIPTWGNDPIWLIFFKCHQLALIQIFWVMGFQFSINHLALPLRKVLRRRSCLWKSFPWLREWRFQNEANVFPSELLSRIYSSLSHFFKPAKTNECPPKKGLFQ